MTKKLDKIARKDGKESEAESLDDSFNSSEEDKKQKEEIKPLTEEE